MNKEQNKKAETPQGTKESGKLSPEQVDVLKMQNEEVYEVTVDFSPTEIWYAYFKYPDRNTLAAALSLNDQSMILEAGERIRSDAWLAGEPRLKDPNPKDIHESRAASSCAMKARGLLMLPTASLTKK